MVELDNVVQSSRHGYAARRHPSATISAEVRWPINLAISNIVTSSLPITALSCLVAENVALVGGVLQIARLDALGDWFAAKPTTVIKSRALKKLKGAAL